MGEKGSKINAQDPNSWKLRKGQLNDAFTTLFFLVQDAWQRSSFEEMKQILEAYKDKSETKPYPITLMRQSDKDVMIKYFVKDTIKHPPSSTSVPPEAKNYLRDNPRQGMISIPTKLCHWLFPESKAGKTAAYAQKCSGYGAPSSYQTYDEVRYVTDEKEESQLASPYQQKHLQYNCGRCKLCRKVWKARIKREMRHFNRHGGKSGWMRDKKKFGPQHKDQSELEKCINLLITRWQKEDGITPSQPVGSPFHTCPQCSYKLPLAETKQAHEEAKVHNAVFQHFLDNLLEQDRKKQAEDFVHDKSDVVPPYIRPLTVSSSMMEGDWYAQAHDGRCKSLRCRNTRPFARTRIFGGEDDDDDDSSTSSGNSDCGGQEVLKEKPKGRKVHFAADDEGGQDDDAKRQKKKKSSGEQITGEPQDAVESKSLTQSADAGKEDPTPKQAGQDEEKKDKDAVEGFFYGGELPETCKNDETLDGRRKYLYVVD